MKATKRRVKCACGKLGYVTLSELSCILDIGETWRCAPCDERHTMRILMGRAVRPVFYVAESGPNLRTRETDMPCAPSQATTLMGGKGRPA